MATDVRAELIDDLIDSYVDWQEECLFLKDAYDRWVSVPVEDRGLAFAAYRAALDREQEASLVYANRCDRLTRVRASGPGSTRWFWQSAAVWS